MQRRRERDARFLGPLVHDLAQNQYHLFFFVQIFLRRYRATSVPAVVDEDVVEAAAALAATFETSGRGIIYEHRAASLPAQRLATDLKTALDELAGKAAAPRDQDAALVLRRTERAAREATKALDGGQTAYFGLLERVLGESAAAATGEEPSEPPAAEGGSRLIIP